jgi:hypothetical protein
LYWVRTKILRRSELMQFERVMSTIRYIPPKGTAGFARSRVSGARRSPCPPARRHTNVSRTTRYYSSLVRLLPASGGRTSQFRATSPKYVIISLNRLPRCGYGCPELGRPRKGCRAGNSNERGPTRAAGGSRGGFAKSVPPGRHPL